MVTVKQLEEIADIVPGYSFRGAIEFDDTSSVSVIRASNISKDADIDEFLNLKKVAFDDTLNQAFLQKNDAVIVARGTSGSFKSTCVQKLPNKVLATSSLFIIRTTQNDIMPEYISLFLNSVPGQAEISKHISGSNIQHIQASALRQIQIPIPPLKTQESLVNLHNNIRQQEKIYERKKLLKQQILNKTFTNIIKK